MGTGPSLFRTCKRIHTGIGCVIHLSEEIQRISPSRILVIADPEMKRVGALDRLKELLAGGKFTLEEFEGIDIEPTLETLERCLKWIGDRKFDAVIGLGGGSSMDVAKVAAAMIANGGSPEDYLGIEKIPQPGVPMIMIPTTAGTGAEVTPNALLIDKKEKVKKSFVSSYLIPDVALVDPVLTVTLPPHLTASTGMDALAHCLESYISLRATPMTELISLEGIRRISGSLREAYAHGENMEARYQMTLGSLYGGIALTNAGTTAVHALAYPLGGRYGISHGISNAIMLPYVMKFNCLSNMGKFARIAEAMGEDLYGLNQREAAFRAIDALFQLASDVKIPLHLKDLKIPKDAIPEMAADAMKWARLLTNNPRQMTQEDAAAIYGEAA
ncbi:MAG: iron-containing alcohol dehydrogenase [candidate division NC10 bacterium]|nr:iron-containing alcohol dehydrogenase [candidate division NC10 bacterium]